MNGEGWRKRIYVKVDTGYSYSLAKRMERYCTNPVLGYRIAGSKAEFKTDETLIREMEPPGLSDVHKGRICVDSWEFEKIVMVFTDSRGREHWFRLGACQTDFHTGEFREFSLVYLGKGAAADYGQVDVTGELTLIDINQRDEWWINFSAYQAQSKRVTALIAVREQGHGETNGETFNAQDITGPDYILAFSMSRVDASALKAPMGENKQAQVRPDTPSIVLKDQETYNIIGSIPGTEEGMIPLSAHYNPHFSELQDDNAMVATMLGITRAMLRSGYKSKKTLMFCAMAAGEWGVVDSKYDRSADAYEQVFTAGPDQAGKVIMNLNFGLPAHTHGRKNAARCVYEYADFLEKFITGLPADFFTGQPYPGGVEVPNLIRTWPDDPSMAVGGIPSIVNDFSAGESIETYYHFQYDNKDFYQEPVYRFHHEMYAGPVLAFDRTVAVPINSARLFEGTTISIDGSVCRGADTDLPGLHLALRQGVQVGEALYNKIREISRAYGRLLDRGEEEKALLLAVGYRSLNRELLRIFKKEQDYLVRLSQRDDVLFSQQAVQEGVRAMDRAITCLESRNLPGALETVYAIDSSRYVFLPEEEVYIYFMEYVLKRPSNRPKRGAGRIIHRQDLFRLAERLKVKAGGGSPDTREEYDILIGVRENQFSCYDDDIRYMISSAGKPLEVIRQAGYRAFGLKYDLYTSESKVQGE